MLFSKPVNGKLILTLEIQSSIVRGSIIWLTHTAPPQILFTDSIYIPYKQNVDTSYFVKLTTRGLHDTIDAAERRLYNLNHEQGHPEDMPRRLDEIHYVLSSPWVVSQARTVSVDFPNRTAITPDRVSKILSEERATISKGAESMLEPIEEKIFDVRVNGYSVANWRGKEAKNLEISYAITVGSADSLKRLRSLAEKMVHGSKIFFHSSLLLQYVGLRSAVIPERLAYTLIHVHGELTDVVIVERGSCTFFGSYPVGVNTLVRKIAKATSTDAKTADSLLSLYLEKKLDESHTKETTVVIDDIATGWHAEFNKLFKDHPLSTSLPLDTYIGSKVHEELFIRTFRAFHPNARIGSLAVDDVTLYAFAIHSLEK